MAAAVMLTLCLPAVIIGRLGRFVVPRREDTGSQLAHYLATSTPTSTRAVFVAAQERAGKVSERVRVTALLLAAG